MASSLTLAGAMVAAWFGLGTTAAGDALTSADQSSASDLQRSEADRGSRGSSREPDAGSPSPTATPTPDTSVAPEIVVPNKGSGKTRIANGGGAEFGNGRHIKYRVEVEREVPVDPVDVARMVDQTLQDPKSWAANGLATFERVDDDSADLRIIIATPETTDKLCYPLDTAGEVSCRNGDHVALNAKRWAFGADAYGKDVINYRRYLVNHEVGHYLGYDHVECPGDGEPAPVMMQQTKGIGACRTNPWPLSSEL
jgi:hypothetical protein